MLTAVLRAARDAGNGGAVAWALHQLGTRAYCLGDVTGAVEALEEALRIRERLGEDAGAAATRHNLEFIAAPPTGDNEDGGDVPNRSGPRRRALLASLARSSRTDRPAPAAASST